MTNNESLSTKQRQKLKALAHHLKPFVHIGKNELEGSAIIAIEKALFDHELIKVKLLDSVTTDKNEMAALVAEKTNASLVTLIGRTAILYKATEKELKHKIEI